MVGDCPMEFLHTAVCCCQMDPHTRPSFAATVKQLELILIDYPRRPDIPSEPLIGDNVIDSHTTDTVCESDSWSRNTSSSSSSSLLSPGYILKDGSCHRHRSNSENKRRLSWISRHKLFNSATDDLLKSTPAKLMGFFKNVLGLRSKEMSVHAKGRRTLKDSEDGSRNSRGRSQSSILTRVSPLLTKDVSSFNYDLNKNKSEFAIAKQSKSETGEKPSQSVSCPGTPGSSKKQTFSRRHTISPSSPVYSDIPDFNLSISSEKSTCIASVKYGTQADVVSMSSGFASMPDTSSLCTSNNESTSFTESDFSSRTSSLRRQTSLSTEDGEDQLSTPTCKNIKTPHFDRYGSYSVVNAEASSKLALVKEMEKDKLVDLTSTTPPNVKAKSKLRSPTLLSFLLGNRGKSKDTL